MAILTTTAGMGLKMTGLSGKTLAGGRLSQHDASTLIVHSGRLAFTWSGTDLIFNPDATLVSGAITAVAAEVLGKTKKGVTPDPLPFFTITGFDLPAQDMPAHVRSKMKDMLLQELLTGDDTITGADQADRLLGMGGADVILGGAGNDQLDGGEGDDVLDGGLGADRMSGGQGDDLFIVDDRRDKVVETGDGIDEVQSSITYKLPKLVETLTLLGASPIDGTGNNEDNEIYGNDGPNRLYGLDGDDIIDGGGGADHLWGGRGADTFVGGHLDHIFDFKEADGDVLDVSALIQDFDADRITDFMRLTTQNGTITLAIDADGAGAAFTDAVITIEGVMSLSLTSLIDNGTLIAE